jgi:Protein of unknown function (DUF2950)
LVQKSGDWRFDPDAGQKEVLLRRIGENEPIAIRNCEEFVDAEKHYRADAGTPNTTDSSPASLVAKAASGSANSDPVLFHGYYFRLLPIGHDKGKTSGGFALIGYPAEYRSSGVMTFVVGKNVIVYEKDLGGNTSTVASTMTAFHKDGTWRPTDE